MDYSSTAVANTDLYWLDIGLAFHIPLLIFSTESNNNGQQWTSMGNNGQQWATMNNICKACSTVLQKVKEDKK